MLDGSIIATIISTQPATNSAISSGNGPLPPSWWRYRPAGEAAQSPSDSQATTASATSDPARIARSRRGSRRCCAVNIASRRSGGELEVALERVVTLQVHARDAVAAAVPPVPARLGGVHGGPRDRAEDRLREGRRLAGRADVRGHVRLDDRAERQLTLAVVDAERDRDALDGDDLADQAGQVGDGAAQLSGEQLEQGALLLVGRAVVDEDRCLPGLRDQDVLRDVGRHGDRQAADVDALDRPLLDAPRDRRVARLVVRVLADPARAENVAGAHLEQPSLDVVSHGRDSPSARQHGALADRVLSRSIDRHRSNDRTIRRMSRPASATCQLLTGFRPMMSTMTAGIAAFDTELGTCAVRWTERGIAGVRLPSPRTADLPRLDVLIGVPVPVREAIAAITRLMAGESCDLGFVVLDDEEIDPFCREVYAATRAVPPGATATYGEIARAIGRPDAARDVGAALA